MSLPAGVLAVHITENGLVPEKINIYSGQSISWVSHVGLVKILENKGEWFGSAGKKPFVQNFPDGGGRVIYYDVQSDIFRLSGENFHGMIYIM